ncbi:MAG: hypothetical protein H0X07_00105 [Gemmatimonadales bacterium]|nr:hypothetical protein [Gemmatimonadales bacterium]
MEGVSIAGWAALVALLMGVLAAASVRTIAALKELAHRMETLQQVMDGRLSQLVALTAVSSEAIGVEKGRIAEIARVISNTLPVNDPLLPAMAHFERINGEDELVIPVPANPTPTVVLVPTETGEQAAARAGVEAAGKAEGQVADLHRQSGEDGN